jgi:structural maintenance of chromosome 4
MDVQLNRAKIVEKEKNELEGPKNEAVEYLCRENEMAVKRNMLFQKYM